ANLSGGWWTVLIFGQCWRVDQDAAGKEARQIAGQPGAVCVGRGEVVRKARDDVVGELGSVGRRNWRAVRHGADGFGRWNESGAGGAFGKSAGQRLMSRCGGWLR